MRNRQCIAPVVALICGTSSALGAQAGRIRTRDLPPPAASAAHSFREILSLRSLPDGAVLVNDPLARELIHLSANFSDIRVVLDSNGTTGQRYGPAASPMFPFGTDSTLFVDGQSSALLVIQSEGRVAGSMALPKASDMRFLASARSFTDPAGNLIYRGGHPARRRDADESMSALRASLQVPDSSPIVRANLDSRSTDTLAWLRTGPTQRIESSVVGERTVLTVFITPLFTQDDWAVLSDGTVAIVRGHDYHVDYVDMSGRERASSKLPFDWRRITDVEKRKLLDSARTERARQVASATATQSSSGSVQLSPGGTRVRTRAVPGSPQESLKFDFVSEASLPDYWPPVRRNGTLPDLDGNLWILPSTSAQATGTALVYDVVSRAGVLKERVRVAGGRSIIGFGKGGVVFTTRRLGSRTTLERSILP